MTVLPSAPLSPSAAPSVWTGPLASGLALTATSYGGAWCRPGESEQAVCTRSNTQLSLRPGPAWTTVISDRRDDFKKQEVTSTQRFHKKDASLIRAMQRFPSKEDPFERDNLGENFTETLTLTPRMIPPNGKKPRTIQEFRRAVSYFTQDTAGGARSESYECLRGSALTGRPAAGQHGRAQGAQKTFGCHVCGKAFRSGANRRRHEMIHTGEKPHGCPLCGQAFAHCSDLRKHERTHLGEKPHACRLCGKAFSKVSYLRQHQRTHSREKPHECHLCGKAFAHRSHLGKHGRTHTGEKPYACRSCWKAFSDPSVLRRHARTHMGEKPYECSVCGKAFDRSYNFALHQRVHTGEKLYRCPLCGKAFSKCFNLRQHGRTHAVRAVTVEGSPPTLQSSKHS